MFNFFRNKKETLDLPHPKEGWVTGMKEDGEHRTPDIWLLEEHQFQLMFVYDEMQRGLSKHEVLGEDRNHSYYCAQAFTKEPLYLCKQHEGPKAIAMKGFKRDILPVKGELYLVRPYQYIPIDKYKQNGVEFNRRRIKVKVPHSIKTWVKERDLLQKLSDEHRAYFLTQEPTVVDAWTYVGKRSFWYDKIDGGFNFSSVTAYQPKSDKSLSGIKKHYYFNITEYNKK